MNLVSRRPMLVAAGLLALLVSLVAQIALDFTIANRKAGSGAAALDAGAKEATA
jgi:hypothetical protein